MVKKLGLQLTLFQGEWLSATDNSIVEIEKLMEREIKSDGDANRSFF